MILYPNRYIDKVTDIDVKFLEENSIKGLILDVDNTLIDFDKKMIDGLEKWAEELKQNDIKLCILSNSNKKDKVKKISEVLGIPYFYFAKKPFKFGFKKAKALLNLENKNIAVVGDQIFTDILGANRCKMYSILVKPIDEKDIWITVFKRPLENKIIEKYKKSIKG